MRRASASVVCTALLCLVVTACGGRSREVSAIRATASAQSAPVTTTLVPAETSTTATAATTAPPASTTTVRPATTTTRRVAPVATTTTVRPTTTSTTRFPGDPRRAVPWDRSTTSSDGRTLTFSYFSGVPPCSIEDGVQVEETSTAVRVTIYERDGSGGQPCIALAQQKSATVTLASALGSRQVVDGARS